jgi:hypothetical protein
MTIGRRIVDNPAQKSTMQGVKKEVIKKEEKVTGELLLYLPILSH